MRPRPDPRTMNQHPDLRAPRSAHHHAGDWRRDGGAPLSRALSQALHLRSAGRRLLPSWSRVRTTPSRITAVVRCASSLRGSFARVCTSSDDGDAWQSQSSATSAATPRRREPLLRIIGAAMRKLIHVALGVLKSGRAEHPKFARSIVNTVSSVFPLCFFCGLWPVSSVAGAFADLKNPLLHRNRAFC